MENPKAATGTYERTVMIYVSNGKTGGLALYLFLCFLSLQISEMVQSYVHVSSFSKSFNMMMVCIYICIDL